MLLLLTAFQKISQKLNNLKSKMAAMKNMFKRGT